MIYVFFFYLIMFGAENVSNFKMMIVFASKLDLVGTLVDLKSRKCQLLFKIIGNTIRKQGNTGILL